MPRLKYRAIIARPGIYKRKDGSTITKTWEELKKAFQRTPELPLTLGHPKGPSRIPTVREYIGRVRTEINELKQVIEGDILPYDEDWDKIPQHIQERLDQDLPTELSTGQMSRIIDGIERDALYNHVALLVDGEDPICPLGQCGVNIRLESDEGDIDIMTYEQATSTKETEEQPPKEEPQQAPVERVYTFTEAQFQELMAAIKPPAPEAGAKEQEHADIEEAAPEEETAPPPEPTLEPERAFAAGGPEAKKSKYLKEDGSIEIPHDIYLGGTRRNDQ